MAIPDVLSGLADALASGRLDMPIAATYALSEVRAAYRELERGRTHGKIVLLPEPARSRGHAPAPTTRSANRIAPAITDS